MNMRILGLSLYGPLAASTRYRLTQYEPGLADQGIQLETHGLLDDHYVAASYQGKKTSASKIMGCYLDRLRLLLRQKQYAAAIVNAELFPLLPGLIESRLLRIPYIYDFDDAFFLKYRLERFKKVSFLLENKFSPVIQRAAAVTAGNHYLAAHARTLNANTHWLPTVVDTERYQVAPTRSSSAFTVGWIGSPSTAVYLQLLVEPLQQLARSGPVRFVVMGGHAPEIPGVEVIELPWSEDAEVSAINTFDVGVMPLFDDEWAKGKCAFKLIQYMACGVPVVASAVGANVDVVDADCGLLVSGAAQWQTALQTLRDSPELRRTMGASCRTKVEAQYSLKSTLPALSGVIRSIVERQRC